MPPAGSASSSSARSAITRSVSGDASSNDGAMKYTTISTLRSMFVDSAKIGRLDTYGLLRPPSESVSLIIRVSPVVVMTLAITRASETRARIEPVNNPGSRSAEIRELLRKLGGIGCKQLLLVGGRDPTIEHLITRDLNVERGEHERDKGFQTLAVVSGYVERPILIEIVIGGCFEPHGVCVEVVCQHFHEEPPRAGVRAPGAKLRVELRHHHLGINADHFAQQPRIERR